MENEFRELLNQTWTASSSSTSSAQQLNHEQYQPPCQGQPPSSAPSYPTESEQFINSVLSKVSNSISNYMSKVNNFVATTGGGGVAGQNEYTPSQEYLQKFNIYSGLVQQQQQQRNQEYIAEAAFSNNGTNAGCPNLIGIKDIKMKNALAQPRQPNDAMMPLATKTPTNSGSQCTNVCTTYQTPHHQQMQPHFDGPTTSASSSSSSSLSLCKAALLIGNGSSGGSIVDSGHTGAPLSCQNEKKSNEIIIDSTTPPPPSSLPTMHCTSSSTAPRPPHSINFARAVSTGELDKKMANSIRGTTGSTIPMVWFSSLIFKNIKYEILSVLRQSTIVDLQWQ